MIFINGACARSEQTRSPDLCKKGPRFCYETSGAAPPLSASRTIPNTEAAQVPSSYGVFPLRNSAQCLRWSQYTQGFEIAGTGHTRIVVVLIGRKRATVPW